MSSAIQLRFDIRASSLPEFYKTRLLALSDQRITKDGVIVIKAQQFRSQEQNREAALERLRILVQRAGVTYAIRKPTRPTRSSVEKRLDSKTRQSQTKRLRGKVDD